PRDSRSSPSSEARSCTWRRCSAWERRLQTLQLRADLPTVTRIHPLHSIVALWNAFAINRTDNRREAVVSGDISRTNNVPRNRGELPAPLGSVLCRLRTRKRPSLRRECRAGGISARHPFTDFRPTPEN